MNHIDRWCFSLPIILSFSSWNLSWYVAFAFAVCVWLLKMVSRRYRSLFGRRFWGLNFGRRTGPYKMASSVPCLHGAVELLLTGDQHKPCASFNQQARKNTTSVAEGKRKTPQKIASKGAKICKKSPILGSKNGPVLGLVSFKKRIGKPQNGSIFGPQNGGFFLHIFAPFDAIFCGVFLLPSATDVVFLRACWLKLAHGLCWSPVSNNSTAPCRHGTGEANESGLVWRLAFWPPFWGAKTAPVEALWNAAGNYKFRGAQIWAGKGCRLPTGESLMPTEPWGKSVQQDHLTTACNDRTCFKSPNQRPHFRAESSTSHAEDTAPSWKQLFLRSERNLWMLRARSARAFDNVTKVTGPSTLKK